MLTRLALVISLFISVTANAQDTERDTLLMYIGVTDPSETEPESKFELILDGEVVGYAWRMAPENESPGLPVSVFAPGFNITVEGDPPPAGTVESYLDLVRQLRVNTGDAFPAWLVEGNTDASGGIERTESIVWFIDYLDRTGAVEENSKALQALLQLSEFVSDLGFLPVDGVSVPANAVVFGYSMGGLISRHALLTLESQGVNHRVGAYVSLDAPHRGAFLPPALEVYSRTMHDMLKGGFDGQLLGARVGDEESLKAYIKKSKDSYDSIAARQLLGIYTGRAIQSYRKNALPNAGKTEHWKDMDAYFSTLEDDNDLARHPRFYKLREDLVDMGSYPTLPLNVGVSFGRADGAPLMKDTNRSYKPVTFRAEVEPNTRIAAGELKTIRGQYLCRVETTSLNMGRTCPELKLTNQHLQGVFVGPGSIADSFNKLGNHLDGAGWNPSDSERFGILAVGALGGLAYIPFSPIAWLAYEGIGVTTTIADSDRFLTFIPMASALDAKGWARDYPGNVGINNLSTPFDVNIANEPVGDTAFAHTTITENILSQILEVLNTAKVRSEQKYRIGTIGIGAHSPTSDYWSSNAGNFDTPRYILPQSIRELPIVRDAAAVAALSINRDDKSVVAATIAAR